MTTAAAWHSGGMPQVRYSCRVRAHHDFCNELLHNRSVSDPTYARALAKFGESGIVEAASLEGYYTYLSMIMNAARSSLRAGAKPVLKPFPK